MQPFDRRLFLWGSLGGAAALAAGVGRPLLAADNADGKPKQGKTSPKYERPHFSDGDADTLFLSWQRDPTTTMTVSWVYTAMQTVDDARVHFSPAANQEAWQPVKTTSVPYPGEGLFVHRAEITGLSPGAQYKLRIGRGTKQHRFQTMPAKATDTFQFVSGGDSGASSAAIASNIMAARQNPMFVLMGGDIAYDDGHNVAANLNFLRNYKTHMLDADQRLIPLVPAIGNHEVTSRGKERVAPFFQSLYGGLFSQQTYATLDFGDYLSLVLLDTEHVAPIAGAQTTWLDEQLAARRERPHVIVAQHVPSYPSYRSFETTGAASRKHWVPLLQKHNVDLVLEHHDHTFKRTHPLKDGFVDKGGIVYLGDGSWGALRAINAAEMRPYLATASSSNHVMLHRFEGEQRFHLALAGDGRVADVYSTQKRPLNRVGRGV